MRAPVLALGLLVLSLAAQSCGGQVADVVRPKDPTAVKA